VKDALKINFSKTYFFTDSSIVLGMIRTESAKFTEFVGTRVSEIRSHSNVEDEWRWIPTTANPADLGTRRGVEPEQMGPRSSYQDGMEWMRDPIASWPCKSTFEALPQDEIVPHLRTAMAVVNVVNRATAWPPLDHRYRSMHAAKRIYGYVIWAAHRWLNLIKRHDMAPALVVTKSRGETKYSQPEKAYMDSAEWTLLEDAQHLTEKKLSPGVMVVKKEYHDVLGRSISLDILGNRGEAAARLLYGAEHTPILQSDTPLAQLILRDAHKVDHGGADCLVKRSRTQAWIPQARKTAKSIVDSCHMCRIIRKKCEEQIMGPIPKPPT
jgi:hypothetical protein